VSIVTEVVVVVALVLANAAFAGAEVAILAVRRTRLVELADEGSGTARLLLAMRKAPERFLATIQIGITVVSVAAGAFGGATLAQALAQVLQRTPAAAHADDLALAIVVGAVAFLSIVVGELVPKSLALRAPEQVARLAARPLGALAALARPLVWVLTASSNVVLRLFGDRTTFTEARLSREELEQLIDEAAVVGEVEPRAADIAGRAIELGRTRIADVMVARPDVVMLAVDATRADARGLLRDHFHERYPVRDRNSDEIVGYVTARDVFGYIVDDASPPLLALVREPLFALESTLVTDALFEMQRARSALVFVIDEHGVVVGIVTPDDLTEELVGKIFGEHESVLERIHRESEAVALVRGTVPVHEVNRELGLELPISTDWSTIAGLALARSNAIPSPGARITLEDGSVLEIASVANRRIVDVRVYAPPRPSGQ
jgi:putative hemolysin